MYNSLADLVLENKASKQKDSFPSTATEKCTGNKSSHLEGYPVGYLLLIQPPEIPWFKCFLIAAT